MLSLKRLAYLIAPLLLVVGFDQLTKNIARDILFSGNVVNLFHGLIQFKYIENTGGFLGYLNFLPDVPRFWLLTLGVGIIVLALLAGLFVQQFFVTTELIVASLVLGGGISNLLDRLYNNGGVIDFVRLGVEPLTTGVFNLADVMILSGAFYLGSSYAIRKK